MHVSFATDKHFLMSSKSNFGLWPRNPIHVRDMVSHSSENFYDVSLKSSVSETCSGQNCIKAAHQRHSHNMLCFSNRHIIKQDLGYLYVLQIILTDINWNIIGIFAHKLFNVCWHGFFKAITFFCITFFGKTINYPGNKYLFIEFIFNTSWPKGIHKFKLIVLVVTRLKRVIFITNSPLFQCLKCHESSMKKYTTVTVKVKGFCSFCKNRP
jgi:hypothetical protein